MEELGDAMKIVVIANFNKKNETTKAENSRWLLHLRGKIELLKAYFLIGWEMKFISHGFYAAVSDNLEDISKQAYAWSNWIEK